MDGANEIHRHPANLTLLELPPLRNPRHQVTPVNRARTVLDTSAALEGQEWASFGDIGVGVCRDEAIHRWLVGGPNLELLQRGR